MNFKTKNQFAGILFMLGLSLRQAEIEKADAKSERFAMLPKAVMLSSANDLITEVDEAANAPATTRNAFNMKSKNAFASILMTSSAIAARDDVAKAKEDAPEFKYVKQSVLVNAANDLVDELQGTGIYAEGAPEEDSPEEDAKPGKQRVKK